MSRVVVVTDSTANLTQELIAGLPISEIALNLIWGEKTFLDRIDIQPGAFYRKLAEEKTTPTTSQPSPEAFREVYARLLNEGNSIISIHISSRLSGTVDSAVQAKNELNTDRITVIDSRLTSMAMGFPVLAVAKAATEGATLEECAALAEKCCANSGALFTVSTLEYLRRGGRIGGAAAFLGTALDLKPILTLSDGKIEPIERVRTFTKAMNKLVEHLKARCDQKKPLQIAAIHADCPDFASRMMDTVRQNFSISEVDVAVTSELSPVIGAHTGPGTIGVAYMAGI